ncbi:MAG: ribosome recycling factor [Candidatus Sumerlaeia bacterium]
MLNTIKKEAKEKMEKAIEVLEHEFSALRTGRASLGILDGIEVDSYGTKLPLNQVATLSTPDARTIMIQPWDKNVMAHIEKAILAANIGLTPTNDGKVIRLNIPQMTEERRRDVVKVAHQLAEEARVAIRNIRRAENERIKKLEKAHEISEDESHRAQDEMQKITDQFIETINKILAAKEKEIMEV